MPQYTISATHASVFGMDVHARSVTVEGLDRTTGETRRKCFRGCPSPLEIASWMEQHFEGPYYAAYESGCTGFFLARALRALGIDCDVVAVSSIARSSDDRLQKTDRRDAARLLAVLLSPLRGYSVVWVPGELFEAARDLARARADAVGAARRAKQQLSALLLRHGLVWDERTKTGGPKKTWGKEHWAWIGRARLEEPMAAEALESYKQAVREGEERAARLGRLVEAHAREEWARPCVDALCCLKGVDVQTAFLALAQFGDFSRFKNGRSVSKWLGVVPRESSSGGRVSRGRITKAGDGHLRSALVEGAASVSRWGAAPKRPKGGQEASAEARALCDKANRRLAARYEHLHEGSRLHANKARMAVVSELARWMWVVGSLAQEEPRAAAPPRAGAQAPARPA
jgi:transposase